MDAYQRAHAARELGLGVTPSLKGYEDLVFRLVGSHFDALRRAPRAPPGPTGPAAGGNGTGEGAGGGRAAADAAAPPAAAGHSLGRVSGGLRPSKMALWREYVEGQRVRSSLFDTKVRPLARLEVLFLAL